MQKKTNVRDKRRETRPLVDHEDLFFSILVQNKILLKCFFNLKKFCTILNFFLVFAVYGEKHIHLANY